MVRYGSIYEILIQLNSNKSIYDDIREYIKQIQMPWDESLSQDSDRSISIISGCLLDILLEKLIRAYFIKDKKVKDLFSNDHILHSFYSKIQISFYSGLIARPIYNDLMRICKIRNKFAHDVTADLNFQDTSISQIINNCELRSKDPEIISAREKYVIIVQQILDHLCHTEQMLSRYQLIYPIEYFGYDKLPYGEMAVSKSQVLEHMKSQLNK